ncbi:hypothetical protein PHYBLDRAFT_137880 [Phycomyces blakesleeanus NRRL 1555(-)]|uniref:ISXO2-like transposase domain-containing protein n=1 Tax=Phycomyces blakesleeanus (strain ATCC 8743b / DSM 1359 / FGSC 10004 / NBRC 33097 / NRRL 1555) TaxID=763407 RepID=A0A167QV27_PHYB8|nr:hypothetical protein PHYBLDRAFT_137880 [Phycomyces blakesleeanus NRRL 1555(-)]OAD80324.1 hypothetical protein PHYBLDRAFT_137880 [Phycomyces blakesleeanus NRRL 1555(-)]|eukprot:XP_018298364.1 hypothetical protein PHYBLDRAFT_137880 [Phycomyces blakesleeanus NRRL 1555(-)]
MIATTLSQYEYVLICDKSNIRVSGSPQIAWEQHVTPRMTMGVMLSVSPETIRHLIASIHQLIQMDLTNNDRRIGGIDANGQSIIVEIDESKFGKRKYHRGHRVEGVWVLGGIEKTAERKTFLVTVFQRDAATLLQVIKKYVKPNSIIHTNCWAAYGGLASVVDMNYTHRTVTHNHWKNRNDCQSANYGN